MGNIIAILIIAGIVCAAVAKIIIEKRKGVKCIGCPHSAASSEHKSGCGGSCTEK